MAKYYSNQPDFPNVGYSTNGKTSIIRLLDSIDDATSSVRAQSISYLYHTTGDAYLGKDMPSAAFTEAFDRSREVLKLATDIHNQIMERIDGKFTKGVDLSLESLNDVNGGKNPYKTSSITYEKTHTYIDYETGISTTYQTTETYTLAELLNAETTEFTAVQEVYQGRISSVREQLENASDLTEEQLRSYQNMSDDELVRELYSIGQIGDYSQLKHYQWQEDHKDILAIVEIALPFVFLAAAVVATIVSYGAASPALAAAAASVATASSTAGAAYGAFEGGYSAVTGNRLISGTELDVDERIWCGIEAATSLASLGVAPIFKAAGATDDTIRIASKTADYADDVAELGHIGYDAVVNGEDPTLSLVTFAGGKAVGKVVSSLQESGNIRTTENVEEGSSNSFLRGNGEIGDLSHTTVSADVGSHVPDASLQKSIDMSNGTKPVNETVETSKETFESYRRYRDYEVDKFKSTGTNVETDITIKVNGSDEKIKVKAIGYDENGKLVIEEYHTSQNGMNPNRRELLEQLQIQGGIVVGKGKGIFSGGTNIDAGVEIKAKRKYIVSIDIDPANGETIYVTTNPTSGSNIKVRSLDYLIPETNEIDWPPHNGFNVDMSGNPIKSDANIKAGMVVDRYGESGGTFVSPVENGHSYAYEERGLPYPESEMKKHTYRVVKDINRENYEEAMRNLSERDREDIMDIFETYDVQPEAVYNPQSGLISEVFGGGGGIQIKLGTSVSIYEKLGFLEELK